MSNAPSDPLQTAPTRPLALTVVSVVGFICSLVWIPVPKAFHYGIGYGLHLLLSSVLGMICMYGFWKMWRWSVLLYAVLCVIDVLYYWVILHQGNYSPALECFFARTGSERSIDYSLSGSERFPLDAALHGGIMTLTRWPESSECSIRARSTTS